MADLSDLYPWLQYLDHERCWCSICGRWIHLYRRWRHECPPGSLRHVDRIPVNEPEERSERERLAAGFLILEGADPGRWWEGRDRG